MSQSDPDLERAPLPGWAETFVVEEKVTLVHLNEKGLTKAKINVIEHLAKNTTQQPFYSTRHMQETPLASKTADTNLLPPLKAASMGQQRLLKMPAGGR